MAQIHDGHLVADLGDGREIVACEEHRDPLLAYLPEKGQNQVLGRHVQGGRGLVGYEELGRARYRHGDHGSLAHAAREPVGVAPKRSRVVPQAAFGEEPLGPLAGLPLAEAQVDPQGLPDLISYGHQGMEGGDAVLEHYRHLFASQAPDLFERSPEEVFPGEIDFPSAGDQAGLLEEPEDRLGADALAAAALPHEANHAARLYGEGEPVHGPQGPARAGKGDFEALGLQKRRRHEEPPERGSK